MQAGRLSRRLTLSLGSSLLLPLICLISVVGPSTKMLGIVNSSSCPSSVHSVLWLLSLSRLLLNISGVNISGSCLRSLPSLTIVRRWYLGAQLFSKIVLHWFCYGYCDYGQPNRSWLLSLR